MLHYNYWMSLVLFSQDLSLTPFMAAVFGYPTVCDGAVNTHTLVSPALTSCQRPLSGDSCDFSIWDFFPVQPWSTRGAGAYSSSTDRQEAGLLHFRLEHAPCSALSCSSCWWDWALTGFTMQSLGLFPFLFSSVRSRIPGFWRPLTWLRLGWASSEVIHQAWGRGHEGNVRVQPKLLVQL